MGTGTGVVMGGGAGVVMGIVGGTAVLPGAGVVSARVVTAEADAMVPAAEEVMAAEEASGVEVMAGGEASGAEVMVAE
eukprot:1787237-Rhodomonas_salina.1